MHSGEFYRITKKTKKKSNSKMSPSTEIKPRATTFHVMHYSLLCSICKSEATCTSLHHCTKRQKAICLIAHCTLSLYFFGENLHTNIVNFIQADYNTFQKNYYIDKVSFKAFLGNLKIFEKWWYAKISGSHYINRQSLASLWLLY